MYPVPGIQGAADTNERVYLKLMDLYFTIYADCRRFRAAASLDGFDLLFLGRGPGLSSGASTEVWFECGGVFHTHRSRSLVCGKLGQWTDELCYN